MNITSQRAVCGRPVTKVSPRGVSRWNMMSEDGEGKGFGGGEATRDPEPTKIDPKDPKAKQQAIRK